MIGRRARGRGTDQGSRVWSAWAMVNSDGRVGRVRFGARGRETFRAPGAMFRAGSNASHVQGAF